MARMADGLSVVATTFYSSLIAAVFLFLLNPSTKRLKQLRRIALMGLIGMLSVSTLLYYGLTHIKAQQAFIINYLWSILLK